MNKHTNKKTGNANQRNQSLNLRLWALMFPSVPVDEEKYTSTTAFKELEP